MKIIHLECFRTTLIHQIRFPVTFMDARLKKMFAGKAFWSLSTQRISLKLGLNLTKQHFYYAYNFASVVFVYII